jgi:AcrR family transcriptional regulator
MTKRDAILKAADQLFSRLGYGLAGVDAIVAAAGVTKRTLYKQFGSKEGLFLVWLRARDVATRSAMISAVEAISANPKEQLLGLFTVLASIGARPNFHGCPFSRALIEFGAPQSESASQLVALEHKAAIAAWVEERLVAAGIGETRAQSEEIALLYEGTLARTAITHTPDAALAARRLLELRLEQPQSILL